MKEEKLKNCESQNSSRGKSTFENSKNSDKLKSSKNSIKSKENIKPKQSKKIIIYKRTDRNKKNKINEKIEKQKPKESNLKKIINKTKLSKTVLRDKMPSNKNIFNKKIDKPEKTPSQTFKKNLKINQSLLTTSSLSKIKENNLKNSKIKNRNKKNNNNITIYKNSYLTIQNSSVSKNNYMKKNKNILNKTKEEEKESSEDLDNLSLDITPKVITDKMYKKENSTKQIFGAKNNNYKTNIKNKMISLSKNNKKKKFPFDNNTFSNKSQNSNYIKQSLNSCRNIKKNEPNLKRSLNISLENNNKKIKIKNKKQENLLKTEINNEKNNKNKKKKTNDIPKNISTNFNYLRYTVSALNKIVKKKRILNKTHNNSISSRPFDDKKTKSINRKETRNKMKNILIFRNTISRYRLYKKNLLLDTSPIKENIKSPLLSRSSTFRNSTKNCFSQIDNYRMIKSLGKGSYGEVKLALGKSTKIKYAIKIYPVEILKDHKKKRNIENEIKILTQLDNANIVKLYEVIKTPQFHYLVMEYINGISLLEIIKKEKNHYLEEKRALKIFIQIVKAIEYCQDKDICHRDIKLENILTLNNDEIKLIDFGFAVKTNKETYQTLLCGSPSYMAPEIVKREKYIAQYSDIWSLGVLLYSMLYGRFPFKGKTQKELFENIKKCEAEFPDDIKVNEKIIILLKKIFVDIPIQRPSLDEILKEISNIVN